MWMRRSIRSTLNTYLVATCTIQRPTRARGQYGERVDNYVDVAAAIPCRLITDRTNREASRQTANQETMVDTYRLSLPHGTDIRPDDLVLMDSGETYEVTGILSSLTEGADVLARLTRIVQ